MKAKATQPFNAHGIIAKEQGQELEISDPTVIANLETMGFIEQEESKKAKAAKAVKAETHAEQSDQVAQKRAKANKK